MPKTPATYRSFLQAIWQIEQAAGRIDRLHQGPNALSPREQVLLLIDALEDAIAAVKALK
jgi:hypothetical protein